MYEATYLTVLHDEHSNGLVALLGQIVALGSFLFITWDVSWQVALHLGIL